jgi:hypothetical protein
MLVRIEPLKSFIAARSLLSSIGTTTILTRRASQRTASRSRGIRHRCLALEVGMAKLEGIEAVTTYVLRHRPKSSNADALHRPLRIRQNLWQ